MDGIKIRKNGRVRYLKVGNLFNGYLMKVDEVNALVENKDAFALFHLILPKAMGQDLQHKKSGLGSVTLDLQELTRTGDFSRILPKSGSYFGCSLPLDELLGLRISGTYTYDRKRRKTVYHTNDPIALFPSITIHKNSCEINFNHWIDWHKFCCFFEGGLV